jgi:hypothetical protein
MKTTKARVLQNKSSHDAGMISLHFGKSCLLSSSGFASQVNRGGLKATLGHVTKRAHRLRKPPAIDQAPETLDARVNNIREIMAGWTDEGGRLSGQGLADFAAVG